MLQFLNVTRTYETSDLKIYILQSKKYLYLALTKLVPRAVKSVMLIIILPKVRLCQAYLINRTFLEFMEETAKDKLCELTAHFSYPKYMSDRGLISGTNTLNYAP